MPLALSLSLFALFLFATTLFFLALRAKDNGVADEGYGIAFIVVVGATLLRESGSVTSYALILSFLVALWAIRLSLRIRKKHQNKPEDFRYRAWREAWGKWFVVRSYLQIYLLQGVVIFLVALPVTLAIIWPSGAANIPLFLLGVTVWSVGFYFEVRGDRELDRFLADPSNKGRVLASGLWRYSRHPNYFGESVLWCGIAIASYAVGTAGVIVFLSPLLITFLLLFVSGIPMVEKPWVGKPEWEAYKARTSAFIPLPPQAGNEEGREV